LEQLHNEVVCLRINEETSSQLHVDHTKVQDHLVYHINHLEQELEMMKN